VITKITENGIGGKCISIAECSDFITYCIHNITKHNQHTIDARKNTIYDTIGKHYNIHLKPRSLASFNVQNQNWKSL